MSAGLGVGVMNCKGVPSPSLSQGARASKIRTIAATAAAAVPVRIPQ
jgi:hypothetical protein